MDESFISKIILQPGMADVTLTRLSSKGQVVIPRSLRKELGLKEGESFAVTGKDDLIVLKKVDIPTAKQLFERAHSRGVAFARKKGLKESDWLRGT